MKPMGMAQIRGMGPQQVGWNPFARRDTVNPQMGTEGAGGPRAGGGAALFRGYLTRSQVESMLTLNQQTLRNIEKTISDPYEHRRNPEMVKHLMGQTNSLRVEIAKLKDFLANN